MKAHSPRLFVLASACFIAGCLIVTPAAAQRRKAKSAGKTAVGKHRGQRQTASRGAASRRGKKGQRAASSRSADERYTVIPTGPTVPDQIEVIEYGSAKPGPTLAATRPLLRATPDPAIPAITPTPSTKRLDVNIDSARVIEIQQALAKAGFYNGAPTGVYDEATVEAMRQFQANSQIDVTGYPTAHALKRLGLTSW